MQLKHPSSHHYYDNQNGSAMKQTKKFSEYDMYSTVKRSLRSQYPAQDGWVIHGPNDTRKKGYAPDFTVERKYTETYFFGLFDGDTLTEKVLVEVKKDHVITQQHVDQLNAYVRNHAANKVRIAGKIMVVPSGSDTSVVPADMKVMRLRSFKRA